MLLYDTGNRSCDGNSWPQRVQKTCQGFKKVMPYRLIYDVITPYANKDTMSVCMVHLVSNSLYISSLTLNVMISKHDYTQRESEVSMTHNIYSGIKWHNDVTGGATGRLHPVWVTFELHPCACRSTAAAHTMLLLFKSSSWHRLQWHHSAEVMDSWKNWLYLAWWNSL